MQHYDGQSPTNVTNAFVTTHARETWFSAALHRAEAGDAVRERERDAAAADVADLGGDAVAGARHCADGGLALEGVEQLDQGRVLLHLCAQNKKHQ